MKFKESLKEFLFASVLALVWGAIILLCKLSVFVSIIPFVLLDCIVGYIYKNKITTDRAYYLLQAKSEEDGKEFNCEYYDLYHEFHYNRILIIAKSFTVALALGPIALGGISDPLTYVTLGIFIFVAALLAISFFLFAMKKEGIIMELIYRRKQDWFTPYSPEDIETLKKLVKKEKDTNDKPQHNKNK